MDIEMLKKIAENGNVAAMLELAQYYKKEDPELGFQYYEQAANAGSLAAKYEMAHLYDIKGEMLLSLMEAVGRDEEAISTIEKAYYWALDLYNAVCIADMDQKTANGVRDSLVRAVSRLAPIWYVDERFTDMLGLAKNIDHPYVNMIHGLAMYELAETDPEIAKAAILMRGIEGEGCWKEEYQSKYGQFLLSRAVTYLSVIYRVLCHDTDSAYRVMETASRNIRDEELRRAVEDDLTHFRKKLFGGYVYVE